MKPKKSLGQHFLVDQNVLNKICKLENLKNKNVIEIGPGTGNLSKLLALEDPDKLTLIEKDRRLIKDLDSIKFKNKEIIINDILDLNLENIIKPNTIIVGNLPYNISTQILVKFIKFNNWPPNFKKLIFMFQKEVADRISSSCNDKDYGRISILTNYRLKIINKFNVSKNCFYPKPKVDSTILVFEPIKKPKIRIKNLQNLEELTNIFFSFRRKMIGKAFKKTFKNYSHVEKITNINLKRRPSELNENTYYSLAKILEELE